MIEAFYNLKKLPFQEGIEPENLFMTGSALELKKRLEQITSPLTTHV
jgi:hypothetical protein